MATKFDSTDLKVLRGDDEAFIFSIAQNSVGFDLRSYTVEATGRGFADSSERLFNLGITSLQNGSDFSVGKVVMLIPDDVTKSLPAQLSYDVQARYNDTVTTLVRGMISVYKDLTR